MESLTFTLSEDDATQPAVGLVILQSDETMEHELRRWLPDNYRLFHTRIPNSQHIDEHSLQAMKAHLPASVSLLPEYTAFRVIAYGCTSAATVIGEQAVAEAITSVIPDCAVTNPLSAIKANLKHIGAKRIALLTPYEPAVTAALYNNLVQSGYSIVHAGSFNEQHDHRVARISRGSLLSAMQELAGRGDVDALVASCTNLRTYELIEDAGARVGCPVVSSNSALAWHIQQLAAQ